MDDQNQNLQSPQHHDNSQPTSGDSKVIPLAEVMPDEIQSQSGITPAIPTTQSPQSVQPQSSASQDVLPHKVSGRGRLLKRAPIVIIAVLLIGLAALYVLHWQSTHLHGYESTHASVGIFTSKDLRQRTTYIALSFKDSLEGVTCSSPSPNPNFVGTTKLQYVNSNTLSLTLTQNMRPPTTAPSGPLCNEAQDLSGSGGPASKQITLNQAWLDSGSPNKVLMINQVIWPLVIDKSAYRLTLHNTQGSRSTQAYLPIDVVELSIAQGCMTEAAFNNYLSTHNIELANQKYPGITANMEQIFPSFNTHGYKALVIEDNFVKTLSYEGYNCQVQLIPNPGGNMGYAMEL
jgi:hypothetical protein